MGGTQLRRHGGISPGDQWRSQTGATVLSLQFKTRRGNLCPSGPQSLGRGKQSPLDHGCFFQGRPEPRSRGLRRPKPGHAAKAGVKPTQTRKNQETRNQGKNAQRWLGSSLPAQVARRPTGENLNASALAVIQTNITTSALADYLLQICTNVLAATGDEPEGTPL